MAYVGSEWKKGCTDGFVTAIHILLPMVLRMHTYFSGAPLVVSLNSY